MDIRFRLLFYTRVIKRKEEKTMLLMESFIVFVIATMATLVAVYRTNPSLVRECMVRDGRYYR